MSDAPNKPKAPIHSPGANSLAVKLTLAFVAVILLSVAVVALVSGRVATEQFAVYVSQGGKLRAETLAPDFEDFYAQTGSWDGVDKLMIEWANEGQTGRGLGGSGRGQGRTVGNNFRLLLTDTNGQVLADSAYELIGSSLTEEVLVQGTQLNVDGQRVGTLVITISDPTGHGELEQQYLDSVRQALTWAGVLGGVLGISLGGLLAYQIIAPLRRLRSAAAAIAAGDLDQQVNVTSQDEIGDLAGAFNHMAAELRYQQETRRNMVADIAHELRTPLSVVRGSLEAMLDGVHPLDQAHVAPVYEETLLLQRLVDDLRLLSLADAGQLVLEMRQVDVAELITSVGEAALAVARESEVTLEWRVEEQLPPVRGDTQRLRQVLNNLVSNALRHTRAGGRIEITAVKTGHQIEIAVADTGPGIEAQDLPHIFERFYRGDRSRARRSGGTGLGLAITHKLIESHGGRIWVESEPGQGARFVFRLSLATAA